MRERMLISTNVQLSPGKVCPFADMSIFFAPARSGLQLDNSTRHDKTGGTAHALQHQQPHVQRRHRQRRASAPPDEEGGPPHRRPLPPGPVHPGRRGGGPQAVPGHLPPPAGGRPQGHRSPELTSRRSLPDRFLPFSFPSMASDRKKSDKMFENCQIRRD